MMEAKQQAKIKDIEGYNRDLVNRYGKDSVEIAAIENKAQFDKKCFDNKTKVDADAFFGVEETVTE